MRSPIPATIRQLPRILAAAALMSLLGCGGGGAEQLAVRPTKPEPIGRAEGRRIELPRDGRFLIALAPSQQAPGLDGQAVCEARVSPEGHGSVTATVRNGGTASGAVQIGHSLTNDTARQADVEVSVSAEVEFDVRSEETTRRPEASVSLLLYARDDRNRELATVELARHSSDKGAAAGQGSESVQISLTLGPGQTANVYLAGEVTIVAEYGRSAAGSIKLSDVRMTFDVRSAPPVSSAANEP